MTATPHQSLPIRLPSGSAPRREGAHRGVLDDRTRELITVTVLACLQTLPQLKAHTAAALNVGVQPIQLREAVYQLAPSIGFPRTLTAVATSNEVFQDRGIEFAPCGPRHRVGRRPVLQGSR